MPATRAGMTPDCTLWDAWGRALAGGICDLAALLADDAPRIARQAEVELDGGGGVTLTPPRARGTAAPRLDPASSRFATRRFA